MEQNSFSPKNVTEWITSAWSTITTAYLGHKYMFRARISLVCDVLRQLCGESPTRPFLFRTWIRQNENAQNVKKKTRIEASKADHEYKPDLYESLCISCKCSPYVSWFENFVIKSLQKCWWKKLCFTFFQCFIFYANCLVILFFRIDTFQSFCKRLL